MPDDPVDVEGYVTLIAELRAEIDGARKAERERLAEWFEANGDALAEFSGGTMSTSFVAFLLRLSHD